MDAGIQAIDGSLMVTYMPDLTLPKHSGCHPWALDFGIPAEMTVFNHLCITMSEERGNDKNRPCLPCLLAGLT